MKFFPKNQLTDMDSRCFGSSKCRLYWRFLEILIALGYILHLLAISLFGLKFLDWKIRQTSVKTIMEFVGQVTFRHFYGV
jgi:hypothetical protein